MTLDLNLPSVDQTSVEEGVWVDFTNEISFLIAREGNIGHRKALSASYKKHKRFIDQGSMNDEQADLILVEIIATHVLLGWKGLKSNNKKWDYSKDHAIALLSDTSYGELREWIVLQSRSIENYRGEDQKK